MQPEHHHHHDPNLLAECGRDTFDAQGLTRLSEQPDHRLAKLAQGGRSERRIAYSMPGRFHWLEC